MALTTVTVTGTYPRPDGSGLFAQGWVRLVANSWIQDAIDDKRYPPLPVQTDIEADGQISQLVLANDDPDADPQGTSYTVTEHIVGVARDNTYVVQIPHDAAGGTIDLADLAHMVAPPAVVAFLTAAEARATYAPLASPHFTGTPLVNGQPIGTGGSGLNIDGGTPTSTYTSSQTVDGGTP